MSPVKNLGHSLVLLLIIGMALSCDKEEDTMDLPIVKGEITDTLLTNGVDRRFITYVPEVYDGKEAVPLVLYFHCARKKVDYPDPLKFVGDTWTYEEMAEQENFILVTPQSSIKVHEGKEWWVWNEDRSAERQDDVGFVNALIDFLSDKYNIDNERIYACGYSWGAFFSFSLACDLSDRIAAIAGLSGYMRGVYLDQCEPLRPVPVLQIHGGEDTIADYNEDLAADPPNYGVWPTLDFWIAHNQTSTIPVIDTLDLLSYWSKREHYYFKDGDQGSTVEHINVWRVDHNYDLFNGGNRGINVSEDFWTFLSKYDINGKIE